MPAKKRNQHTNILDQVTPEQAISVLRDLWITCPDVRVKIEAGIKGLLKSVDCNEVAAEVESNLHSLDEEELYDRSGPSRTGYHDSGEMAGIMIGEILAPYQDQSKRYSKMGMEEEAKEYCKGILKGLYEYERNSSGPFSECAQDAPVEMFAWIVDEWKKNNRKPAQHAEMKKFIDKECSDWSKYIK